MKKYYTLLCSIFLGLLITKAQVNLPERHSISIAPNSIANNLKTTTCIDTIRYPESKLTGLLEVDTLSPNAINTVSQAYHFNGSGTIHGLNAYLLLDLDGIPSPTDSISLVISVYSLINYSAAYPNAPDAMIATDTVSVFDVGFNEQTLMFSSPVMVTDSFVLTLGLDATAIPSPLPYYGFNGYGDGAAEKLAWANYLGTWYNAYTDWVPAWDSDILLSPVFEQDVSASFMHSQGPDTTCVGDTVLFTNMSNLNYNSMFNPSPPTYVIDFGDGNSASLDTTLNYVFTTQPVSQLEFTVTNYGYNSNCSDVMSNTVMQVNDTAISNYSYGSLGGGSYQFTDMSSNADTYYWDFGDGDTSTTQSPMHTYLVDNNYNVCLTVSDANGCNVNTSCQTVSFVTAIVDEEDETNEVRIYPIPANKYFTVVVPEEYRTGSILLTDIVGKTVKNEAIDNQEELKISTHDINAGIYFLTIENNGQKVYTKRIAVDKK